MDNKNNITYMYVLSIKDIQAIRKCTYSQAKSEFSIYDYFYINSKPYILAADYFGEQRYQLLDIGYYENIEQHTTTKVIKVVPQMYTVSDIQQIFGCGQRQAYEIMDLIPWTFRINSKRYVDQKRFVEWLETLPNQKLKIA